MDVGVLEENDEVTAGKVGVVDTHDIVQWNYFHDIEL